MARRVDDFLRRSFLHEPPGVEQPHAVAEPRDHPQVVADQQDRRVELGLQLLHQLEHLRLDRRVESSRWLVEDEHVRRGRERHRDEDALLLACGQLVRVPPEDTCGVADPHLREQAGGGLGGLARDHPEVRAVHLRDLRADLERRVERTAGPLRDERDPARPPVAERPLARREDVVPAEEDAAAFDAAGAGQVAEQRQRERRLPGSRLADKAVRLAALDAERHTRQRAHAAVAP